MTGVTYRNVSAFLPAHRATIWVGGVCLWPGQTATLREALPDHHPAIARGLLRRITDPAASGSAPPESGESREEVGGAVDAPTRSELWTRIKASKGGAAAYRDAMGRGFRASTSDDLTSYLERL